MNDAFNKLFEILLEKGLDEKEVTELLARFLEQEAPYYIEWMQSNGISIDDLKQANDETPRYKLMS